MLKKSLILLFIVFCLFLFVCQVSAADLEKNHSIDLSFGYRGNFKAETSVSMQGVNVIPMNDRLTGRVAHSYFFKDNLAVQVSLGFLQAKVTVAPFSVESSSIVPILLGMKFYPLRPSDDGRIKPFLLAGGGLLVGSASGTGLYSAQPHTEGTFLFYAGGGCDFVLGSLIKLSAGAGYNLAADFSRPIGGRTNFSGSQFSLGIGFLF